MALFPCYNLFFPMHCDVYYSIETQDDYGKMVKEWFFDRTEHCSIYSISDRAKELAPELWQSHIEYVDKSLIELYEQGLVEIEYNEKLEATIHLTPEGQKIAREKGLIEMDLNPDIPND